MPQLAARNKRIEGNERTLAKSENDGVWFHTIRSSSSLNLPALHILSKNSPAAAYPLLWVNEVVLAEPEQ